MKLLSKKKSGEVRAGRHLWMTGSISVKGTLIDKYAFQKNVPDVVSVPAGLQVLVASVVHTVLGSQGGCSGALGELVGTLVLCQ